MRKMWLLKCVLCAYMLCFFGFVNAKECRDCISIRSCRGALTLAIQQKDKPDAKIQQRFTNAFCGFDGDVPKLCCSEFPDVDGQIENHKNLGLLPEQCGAINGDRIVGGTKAKLYEFPWMALISYHTRNGLQFQCGGSIINSRYILTAAHCVVPPKKIAGVRIGELDISTRIDCEGELEEQICESHIQDIGVEDTIIHPLFRGTPPVQHDIALLRLDTPIDMSYKNAAPICLPTSTKLLNVVVDGRNGTVAGWGATEAGNSSPMLLKVIIPIKAGESCRKFYNKQSLDSTDKTFCAGELMKDSCNGDSGGPLMVEEENNGIHQYFQYGVVSYGPRQCGSNYPGVYTDVTKFVQWVLDKIKP